MPSRRFTDKERKVILGLCSSDRESDRIISRKVGLKSSTFSTIRKSLVDRQILMPVRIPNYYKMGLGHITISSGNP
jgi:hypothetical protein